MISWAIGDVGVEDEGLAMAGILNLFLLPIIIFEAGWSMNHRAFVDLLLLGLFRCSMQEHDSIHSNSLNIYCIYCIYIYTVDVILLWCVALVHQHRHNL